MLTLQQLLESDSIATIVAKLNQNFQSLTLSNGGPQGIIGRQGIPGLPGRVGPHGPTGPQGPTGTIAGIIPFSAIPGTGTTAGPDPSVDSGPNYGKVGPWPQSSWQWLKYYHSNGVTIYGVPHVGGQTPRPNDIYIDHANNGYWKFLNQPDEPGAHNELAAPPYTNQGAYSAAGIGVGTYPNLGVGLGWVGSGWYYYPTGDAGTANLTTVWLQDTSTYLLSNMGATGQTGPYGKGAYENTGELEIPNARLITKYGTVWITSGNDATDTNVSYADKDTSTIGLWGAGSGNARSQPARNNSGIDRLLFKMSLDGLPYLSNIEARGIVTGGQMSGYPDTVYPQKWIQDTPLPDPRIGQQMIDTPYWVSPQYGLSLEKYTPLLFLTQRDDTKAVSFGTYGSLGIYMYTDTTSDDESVPAIPDGLYGAGTTVVNNNVSKTIHLFTSRYSVDPLTMFQDNFSAITSASTKNYGEMLLDFRRVTASNQYVCSLPTDLKLSSDYISGTTLSTQYYDENNGANVNYKFKTNQGYISAINGKAVTGASTTADYWEYGLGGNTLAQYNNGNGGTHDTQSGTSGMRTRRSWYGSSVLSTKPSDWNGGTLYGEDNYIRVAGMMERGRRSLFTTALNKTAFLSELIFYTSGFTKTNASLPLYPGITNDEVNPSLNEHRSLPSLYVSPFTNIGIGTFVGGHLAANDQGPLEPSARLHVHLKETDTINDPTETYKILSAGSGNYATLPRKTFAVAAFTGDIDTGITKGNIDILFGSLSSQTNELVNINSALPVNTVKPLTGDKQLRNAIRSEAWSNTNVSTLRLGAQPFAAPNSIGRTAVDAFRNEFQIALHPLNVSATDLTSSLTSITGVGIHNMFPRARVHFFGKNTYNESEYGAQLWTPGLMSNNIGTSFPYYGANSVNTASANQVIIDYIGDSYKYPVGLYEYQYYVFNIAGSNPVTTGLASPNSAVYPSREILSPTRFAVPYGAPASINLSYPSTNPQVVYNNSYKHGGAENAWWEPSSFIGFNLYRDLSNADGNSTGDNRDNTRWILGTQGTDGLNHGNNGGAAIISSNTGELGIITIPRGRDGGRAYEEWEQRGLGTRDVLNQMKIIFDKNGNIAIGNAAGWDLDAYPSLTLNKTTGYLNYVPFASPLTGVPASALNASTYVYSLQTSGARRYGGVNYTQIGLPADILTYSTAANVNKNSSSAEYVRIEVGAEKAWSRDGRMAQKLGYGYPINSTITISGSLIAKYVRNNYVTSSANSWVITTDAEGRIINNQLTFNITPTSTPTTPVLTDFIVIFPHPTEFNTGGPLSGISGAPSSFTAPAGAIAAEWWGMSTDTPVFGNLTLNSKAIEAGSNTTGWDILFIPTTDTRGSANVRLNNFVYGEGFGFSGTSSQAATGVPRPNTEGDYTKNLVRQKRQESPKLILSFLEKTPNTFEAENRLGAGTDPYLKVNTVIQSAQNEAALREYWIPKTDNTGGTFMVFTDHFGKKEKDSGFDDESIVIGQSTPGNETTRVGLHLEEVVTQEFLAGYSGTGVIDVDSSIITEQSFLISENSRPVDFYPGYVRYYNRSYNYLQQEAVFANTTYGQLVDIGPTVVPPASGAPTTSTTTGGSTLISPNKSTYKIAATQPLNTAPPLLSGSSAFSRTIGTMRPYNCAKTTAGTNVLNYLYGFQSGGTTAAAYTQPALKNNSFVTNSVTGDPFLWSDYTGVITIATSGNYEFKYAFSSASVSRCDNNTMVCDSGSVRFQQDEYRDVSLNLYVNGNYENNVLIAFSSNGSTTCPPTGQPNIKSPGSGDRTYTAYLSAGATIKLEYDFRGQARYQCYGVGGDTCGSNNSYISNYNHTGNITFSLKSLDAECDNTPINGQPTIAIGGTIAESGWNALFQKPEDIYYSCPAHTMINVYDTISANSGTHNGSIARHLSTGSNAKYIQFERQPIAHEYDGVKITIDIAARTPNDKKRYTTDNKDLILRFLQSGYDLASITSNTGGVPNIYVNGVTNKDVLYGVIPGKLTTEGRSDFVYTGTLNNVVDGVRTANAITGIWVYDGTVELYMTKSTWESGGSGNPYWALCGAFFTKGTGQFTSDNNYATISGEHWLIDRLQITFEELVSNTTAATATSTTTTTIPNSATGAGGGANRSSIRRNIDHFYSIYSPDANYDNGWNTLDNTENAPVIDNAASSIRMKRINSEFALVDFNITVRVDNPYLGETAADSLIDFGSPRFTQYLRFTYVPDEAFWNEDQYRQDIAQDLFGNGMWFSNWSSYKNWLSGTAIVGDDTLNLQGGANLGQLGSRKTYGGDSVGFQPQNVSSDWSPTFNDENVDRINYRSPFGRTWNGNILEMLSFQNRSVWQEMAILRGSTNYGILSDPLGNINGNGSANAGPGQSVFSAFGGDGRMLRLANTVFNLTGSVSTAEKPQKQKAFAGFLGGMHAMWGNQAFERNTNVQWRMSPTYNYIADQTVETAQDRNNGFSLEVQFSKPILHVDTPLGIGIYGGFDADGTNTVQPYRFLTVSGQGMVRYAETIKDPLPTVRTYDEYTKSLYE